MDNLITTEAHRDIEMLFLEASGGNSWACGCLCFCDWEFQNSRARLSCPLLVGDGGPLAIFVGGAISDKT